jgi:hypothetical protein
MSRSGSVKLEEFHRLSVVTESRFPMRLLAGWMCLLGMTVLGTGAEPPSLPERFTGEQKANLTKFLEARSKPDRYVPAEGKVADLAPPEADRRLLATAEKPIRQFLVQVTPHRAVPDDPTPTKVDVVYYRPHPEKGKPGLTLRHTVDVASGQEIGVPQILTKAHTPLAPEELTLALEFAQKKFPAVAALYRNHDAKAIRWEYLQMMVQRPTPQANPGDRVARFVFRVDAPERTAEAPKPVAVLVNLTQETVHQAD